MAWPDSDEDSDSENEEFDSDNSTSDEDCDSERTSDEDDSSDSDNEDRSNPHSLFDIAGKNLLFLWTDGHLWTSKDDDESNEGYFPSNKEIYTVMTLGKQIFNIIFFSKNKPLQGMAPTS